MQILASNILNINRWVLSSVWNTPCWCIVSVTDLNCDLTGFSLWFSPKHSSILAEWGLPFSTAETYSANPPHRVTHTGCFSRKCNSTASLTCTLKLSHTCTWTGMPQHFHTIVIISFWGVVSLNVIRVVQQLEDPWVEFWLAMWFL